MFYEDLLLLKLLIAQRPIVMRLYLLALFFLVQIGFCMGQDLKNYQLDSFLKKQPAVALENPVGGGQLGAVCFSLSIQDKSKLGNEVDGSAGVYVGLGDPDRFVGAGATVHVYGLSNRRGERNNQGAHSVNLHFNKLLFKRRVLLDVGVDNAFLSDNVVLTKYITFIRSFYFSANYLATVKQKNTGSFNYISITTGAGNGYYRSDRNYRNKGSAGFDPFFSIASPLCSSTNLILEWNGYDFGIGLSSIPIKKLPFMLTLDVTDLAYGQPRIVSTFSIPFQLFKVRSSTGLLKAERPISFRALRPVRTL
jgi:hypothetical protein